MTASWRAVPLADAAAGWTAVAGGTDIGWLFAPGGRWAAVTGSDSAPLLGTVPMRTALGAAVFDSPAGEGSGLRCVAAVSGARTQDDRAALCLFATDRGRFGVADDIVAKIIDVPTDGPVAHWPVLGGGGSAGPVVTAWADGDETVTLRSAVVDPEPPHDRHANARTPPRAAVAPADRLGSRHCRGPGHGQPGHPAAVRSGRADPGCRRVRSFAPDRRVGGHALDERPDRRRRHRLRVSPAP